MSYLTKIREVDGIDKSKDGVLVKIRDLKKTYFVGNERVRALRGVDLDIHRGELVIILGTSGSGKSTFLNMLAGLEKPTKGSVHIMDVEMTKLSEKKLAKFRQKHIGFIFQSYNLIPTLTALENVGLPLVFKSFNPAKRDTEAARLLKAVGLASHAFHKPSQMSGGQQQRVGIARAFAGSPDIIFADEPTGNLDTKTSASVMNLMIQLARDNDQTMIMVSHDPAMQKYGDKIVRITDGVIEEVIINDKPQEGVTTDETTN